jgi:hypothetical protein
MGDTGDGGTSLLWSATFEGGDLSEWMADGQGGVFVVGTTVSPSASADVAHRGRYAGKATMTPPGGGVDSLNYFFRNQPSPAEAYYSAWFYIPSSVTVRSWLSLHHFRCSRSGDGNNLYATWDLNLYPRLDGTLVAHLFDFVTARNLEQVAPIPVPLATWVHFEVLLRKAADATGAIAVWQDDVLILENRAVATAETDWVQWDAGGSSDDIAPLPAVVYIDDAAISLSRLGTADWSPR